MRIILITNTSNEAYALEASLLNHGITLSAVIRHALKKQQKSFLAIQFDRLRGLVSRLLSMNSAERAALKYEHRCFLETKANMESYLETIEVKKGSTPKYSILEVENLNSEEVESTIKSEQPTLCVVWGTGILRKKILNAADHFVNAHSSLLPAYRGTRSEFWQCYHQEYDAVGVTFHLISRGVDTGDIMEQFPLSEEVFREPHHLRAANTRLVLEKYPAVIKSMILENRFTGTPQIIPNASVTYKFADVTREKILELYMRILKQQRK